MGAIPYLSGFKSTASLGGNQVCLGVKPFRLQSIEASAKLLLEFSSMLGG
jgi:hypothetical protein